MAKDPAFLFYSKDWLEGTAELLPAEKGVYIDLLSHQHQKGDLPNEPIRLARLVGLSLSEFEPIWNTIKNKFKAIAIANDGANASRIANEKLSDVMGDRAEKGRKNKISGIFSGLLRKNFLPLNTYKRLRNEFKIEEFNDVDSDRLSDRISEWFAIRLKSIENANADATATGNATAIGIPSLEKEGAGEKTFLKPGDGDSGKRVGPKASQKTAADGEHNFQESEYFTDKAKWYAALPADWCQEKKEVYWQKVEYWSSQKKKNKKTDWPKTARAWDLEKPWTGQVNGSKPMTDKQKLNQIVNHGVHLEIDENRWVQLVGTTTSGHFELDPGNGDMVMKKGSRTIRVMPTENFKSSAVYELAPGKTIHGVYQYLLDIEKKKQMDNF